MQLVIPTLFGLEGLAADELRFLGMNQVITENGRVLFEGDFEEIARANLRVRIGERVLILLSRFHAESFEELFTAVKEIPWEWWIGKEDAFPVKGWSLNSQLHSIPDCQSIVKKAVVDRLGAYYHLSWFSETGPTVQIQFSIMKDEVCIMLDTSGPGLHKRGYRANANAAPLRETLAAGMIDVARLRSDSRLIDPMCGSGTILIEAAMRARNISPGLMRRFACEKWSCFPEDVFDEERKAVRALIRKKEDTAFEGFGFDVDPACVSLTLENAKKAHVENWIRVEQKDIRQFRIDPFLKAEKPVTLIVNPPYGERMLEKENAQALYKIMGKKFPSDPQARYFVITSDEEFETYFGRKADKKRKLYNGMLKCNYYMYINRRS